jgi:hypothetical protein
MKIKYLIYLLFLVSCSPSTIYPKYYDPALLGIDISYQPKPMAADSLKEAKYISAGINQKVIVNGSQDLDLVYMIQSDLSRAHTFKGLNIAYGVFGMAGIIENGLINEGKPYYYDKKSFTALGARGSVNTFFTRDNVDYRIIGAEFSFNKELGDFAAFRKTIKNEPYYYTVHNTQLFTAGLTSEVIVHSHKNTSSQLGARLFLGRTFTAMSYHGLGPGSVDNIPSPDVNSVQLSFFGQLKRFHGTLEVVPSGGQVKMGYRF